jgi:hypothetical protein
LLSKDKLESALEEGRQSGRRLGEILLQKGWIEEKDLARLLAGQKGLAFVSLKGRGFDPEIARLLPERVCRYHCALAMEEEAGKLLVAVADPTDDSAVGDIRAELNQDFRLVVATASEIRKALDDVFAGVPPVPAATESPGLAAAHLEPEPVPAVAPELGLRVALPEPEPAPVVPAVAPELGLRVALPEPEPRPEPVSAHEPEPEPEPVILDSSAAHGPQPERVVLDSSVTHEPEPLDEPATLERVPRPRVDEFPPIEFPPSEPTIERNEHAHVSVAFHAPVPEPEPDPEPEPGPALAPAPRPIAAAPDPIPAPADDAPAPQPTPVPEHRREQPFRVVLVMDGDDEVELGAYPDEDSAAGAARNLITQIARLEEWPRVGRRFLRPERIVSVDIRERTSFAGSQARAQWGATTDPS